MANVKFKEIKTEYGIRVWVCLLDDKEIARCMSLSGIRTYVLRLIRKYKQNGKY